MGGGGLLLQGCHCAYICCCCCCFFYSASHDGGQGCVRVCVCGRARAQRAQPGCLLEIEIAAWLTYADVRRRRSIKKERIKASQQANAPPELPLKVFLPANHPPLPLPPRMPSRVGGCVCGYPAFRCSLLLAAAAARCSMLSALIAAAAGWHWCGGVLFVLPHTHTHAHTWPTSAHSPSTDYI